MLENIKWYEQNSIKINNIYFDPYNVTDESHDAEIIFITHSHYDHFSLIDLEKVKNENTLLVIPGDCLNESLKIFNRNSIILVEPNKEYKISNISFKTIPMYNIGKTFHSKSNNWIGYLINMENINYYIVGDSDITDELINVKCDILIIPIGGKYTMDIYEAVEATTKINPKFVIPIHYGTIIGDISDGETFKNNLPKNIKCILKK